MFFFELTFPFAYFAHVYAVQVPSNKAVARVVTEPVTRVGLSRDAILDAGLRIARSEDLSRITIRKLADEFGVTPMAIYRYVANKAEIIEGVVDRFTRDAALTDHDPADWRGFMHATFGAWRRAFIETPGVIALVGTSYSYGRRSLEVLDRVLSVLRAAGIGDEAAVRGLFAMSSYTLGAAATEAAWRARPLDRSSPASEQIDRARERYLEAAASGLPTLGKLAEQLAVHQLNVPFEDGLDRILDSLEREIET